MIYSIKKTATERGLNPNGSGSSLARYTVQAPDRLMIIVCRAFFKTREVFIMAKQKRKKRADGRLSSSFTYNGKRYYVYGQTAKELKEKEAEKLTKLKSGQVDRKNPTLNEYYSRFTENRRSKVKEATIRGQRYQFHNCANVMIRDTHMRLGEMRIRDITASDIEFVQQTLEKSKMTTETVNNNMSHLCHVFSAAVNDDTIDKSPCRSIGRIKRTEKPARESIHRALTEQETQRFMTEARDSVYYNAFCLMLFTGMRIGEVGALSHTDVDMKNGIIHVSKTVTRTEVDGYAIGTPKTTAGQRVIPMNDDAKKCIQRQLEFNRLVHHDKVMGTIFRSPEGALLREYPVNREIKRICKRIGMEKFTCHAFRATFATRFIEQQPFNYKALSEIMGHTKTKVTLDLYAHCMKETKIEAMKSLVIAI